MSAPLQVEDSETGRSKMACLACRQRKVKCSKELPRCSNCRNNQQPCNYPAAPLKPGPKFGSLQKRRHLGDQASNGRVPRGPWRDADSPHSVNRQGQHGPSTSQSGVRSLSEEEALIRSKHIQSISSLIRPRNEPSPARSAGAGTLPPALGPQNRDLVASACNDLGLTTHSMSHLVEVFFRTFTAFRLFREPVFFQQLSQIPSGLHLKALLAALLAFACKSAKNDLLIRPQRLDESHFADLAVKYVNDAINDCGDDPSPLCLLQALILVTHWRCIKNVRGRAWRYIGLCTRLAFELGLHSVDANKDPESCPTDAASWCEDEERRRAYWAIWEMDQFANALKQITVTINWTQNQVFLPAEDEKWFSGQPHQSCCLATEWVDRPKTLHATESKSAKAWYIVFCSLLEEAYGLAHTDPMTDHSPKRPKATSQFQAERVKALEHLVPLLLNAIHLGILYTPLSLKFHRQSLNFGTFASDQVGDISDIHHQHAIYQLAMLPQIARLVTLRPFVLRAYLRKLARVTGAVAEHDELRGDPTSHVEADEEAEQCFNASDVIMRIESHCDEDSYLNVHPYIVHASWLAATVQLLREELTKDASEKKLIKSKFVVLKAIHERLIQYWEMSTVPKQNLDLLAARLKALTALSRSRLQREKAPENSREVPVVGSPSRTHPANTDVFQYETTHNGGTAWNPQSAFENMYPSPPCFNTAQARRSVEQGPLNTLKYPTFEAVLAGTSSAPVTVMGPPGEGLAPSDHNQEVIQPVTEAVLGPDRAAISWDHVGTQHLQEMYPDFDSIDWTSVYPNMETDGEPSDYLNRIFSWSS